MLRPGSAPDPEPGPGDALIAVRATAVNRADILQRRGLYPPPAGTSSVLGLEAAGEVIMAPAGGSLVPGDRVMCLVGGGGYAERLAVPAAQCMSVPDRLSWAEAAAIPEAFITAYQGLVRLGRLGEGDTALVHSIASGVGTAAAQVCRAIGARCIGTSRGPVRAFAGTAWGATGLVVTDATFAGEVHALTGGRGADVILDLVGAKYLAENVASLAPNGRLVLTGLVGGRTAGLDLGALIAAQGTILASSLRARPPGEIAEIMRDFAAWALPRFAHGDLSPVVHAVLPLDEAAEAHRIVESNQAVGKVVLLIDAPSPGISPADPPGTPRLARS